MNNSDGNWRLRDELLEALRGMPLLDVHSHMPELDGAPDTGIGSMLFYHMLQYPLRAAGMTEGMVSLDWRDAHAIPKETLFQIWERHGASVLRTSFGWTLRMIAKDLYGFEKSLDAVKNLEQFDKVVTEARSAKGWDAAVLAKGKIAHVLSSRIPDKGPDAAKSVIDPTIEPGVLGSSIHETGRTLGKRLAWLSKKLGRPVASLADVKGCLKSIADGKLLTGSQTVFVAWISSLIDFTPVPEPELERLFDAALKSDTEDPRVTSVLDALFVRLTLRAIAGKIKVFQICYGSQYFDEGSSHPIQRARPDFADSLAHLLTEFPGLHFNILNGYEPDEPKLCSLCLGYDNISLGGYWWNMFYPNAMRNAWQRRFDMVPWPRLMGFFSDGYCPDWVYGRAAMTRQVLANTLAERVALGFCSKDDALEMARQILFVTPSAIMLGASGPEG